MADAEHTLQVFNRLFALGARIAIDDYGTGYASLSYLKRLPADELKIDRCLCATLDNRPVRSGYRAIHGEYGP